MIIPLTFLVTGPCIKNTKLLPRVMNSSMGTEVNFSSVSVAKQKMKE